MKPARIAQTPALHLIGLRASYTHATRAGIPAQWAEWDYDAVPNVQGDLVYGVSLNGREPGHFDYICALPVAPASTPPKGQELLSIAPGRHAIFRHDGPVAGLAAMFDAINCGQAEWPEGLQIAPGPQLEVYGDGFDPLSATGLVEIWVPLEPA